MKKIVDLEKWNAFHNEKTSRRIQYEHYEHGFSDAFDVVSNWLTGQPDAEEKRGKWIESVCFDDGFWICSSCNFCSEATAAPKLYKYCPNCGAKMDLGEEE